jgi:hypothetical protein
VWWWSAKFTPTSTEGVASYGGHEGTDCWYLVDDDVAEQVLREMEQWKRAAPLALKLWRELLAESSPDKRLALHQRIIDMQNVLLTTWGLDQFSPVVWRRAFFYRTITLDGRWLLAEHEVPPFDVSLFGQQLFPEAPVSGLARDILMRDPVTRGMSELYQDTPTSPQPTTDNPQTSGDLRTLMRKSATTLER